MRTRFPAALGVAVACAAATLSAQTPAPKPAPATQKAAGVGVGAPTARKYVVGRTPWGDPDLQGNWNNKQEVNTPLERPDEWAGKRIADIGEKELADAVVERQRAQVLRYENIIGVPIHWIDRLDSQNSRPWFVIDPPDGKIPPRTDEGKQRAEAVAAARKGRGTADSYTDRGLWDRCASRGPAVTEMQPKVYGNSYQILQSKDYVAIRYEMIHETRLIPIEGRGAARPHISSKLTSVYGDATARWDGSTLVVDTVNYNGKTAFQGSNEGLHTTERFTRTASNRIEWTATAEDPHTWSRPWTLSLPLQEDDGQPIFEYACHEGNYALRNILAGARQDEKTGRIQDRPLDAEN